MQRSRPARAESDPRGGKTMHDFWIFVLGLVVGEIATVITLAFMKIAGDD